MKVERTKELQAAEKPDTRPGAQAPKGESPAGADRVTIEGRQVAELLTNARQRSKSDRAVRLSQLEGAIKAGAYQPDPGRLAEKLLSAAETDARLRALMRG